MDQFVSSVSAFCNLLEEWEGSALMGSHLLSSASAVLGVPRPNDSSTERKFEAVRETKYIRNALDQAMSQRLIEYMQEGSRAGAFHRRSLQQLMDALSGLGNTVDLLKATSQALVDLASDADQVVRQLLSKDGGAKRGFGGEGQPHEGADARMQEDDADKCPVINAVSAALCMREVSDGVHQCTAIMVCETAILLLVSHEKALPWSPLPSYECRSVLGLVVPGHFKIASDRLARKVAGFLARSAICFWHYTLQLPIFVDMRETGPV
eukprot:jgi/Botrbrau1/8004/Bobra.384_2s0029.1